MGDVISFRPPDRPLGPPPWMRAAQLIWNDPTEWRVSAKGNPYVWVAERNVTIWRCINDRWSWVIGARRDTGGQTLWSEFEFDTEQEARDAAWEMLAMVVGAAWIVGRA